MFSVVLDIKVETAETHMYSFPSKIPSGADREWKIKLSLKTFKSTNY